MRRRRGIALIDFMTGMIIFSACLGAFVALSRSKFDTIDATSRRARALEAVELRLDRLRLEGLPRLPQGEADAHGFRLVEEFGVDEAFPAGTGRVDARALTIGDDSTGGHSLYEVRVQVSWESIPGTASSRTQLSVSTLSPLPEQEGR